MSASKLIRWSGLAALLGGILVAASDVEESVLIGSQPDSIAPASNFVKILRVAFLVPILLMILASVGW